MPKNTPAFYAQAVASFVIALVAVAVGIVALPVDPWRCPSTRGSADS